MLSETAFSLILAFSNPMSYAPYDWNVFLHFSRSSPAPCPLVCSIACFDHAVHDFNTSNNKKSEESYSCLMRRNE